MKTRPTRTKNMGRALAASLTLSAFCGFAETPDYFVEYAEPNAALYVDTGIVGKSGTKVEVRVANFGGGEILIGSRYTDSSRFEPVRFLGEQSGMRYGNEYLYMVFSPYYGDWIYDVAVTSAGVMTGTVTDCGNGGNNASVNYTKGVVDTQTTMYLFGSHYKSDTEDKPVDQNLRRVYYCKIWQDDGNGGWTLVRNLKPCVKDGVVGFYDAATGYDSLNGTIFYPSGGGTLKCGNLAYDTIATWNGGAVPTAAELATASNWTCADVNGTAVASVVPGKTALAVLPSGITLPSGYEAPWAVAKIAGTLAHPATLWGREAFSGDRKSYGNGGVRSWQWRDDGLQHYVARGEGDVSYINQGGKKPAELEHAQFRYDGWFNVSAEQAGEWALSQSFDDYFGLCIDGQWVLSYNSYSGGQNATWNATAGWHRFTMIAGDTWGGWGAQKSLNGVSVPFTITTPNYNDGALFKFSDLEFGTGSNTITLNANADWSALETLALCDGTVIDLNGCQLTIKDAVVDGYIGAKFVNSNSKKAVLIFLGEPSASTAVKYSLIDGVGTKILLAKAGELSATWTGAADGVSANNAGNWVDTLTDEAVVPNANYAVTIVGTAVGLQIPAGTAFACKSFNIGDCTLTANCDWTGLSVTPTISGTANLNGHTLTLNHLAAQSGGTFSGTDGSAVAFPVSDTSYDTFSEADYIDNIGNLTLSGSAKILLPKEGSGTFVATTALNMGTASGRVVEFKQTDGDVSIAIGRISQVAGAKATYTMTNGTLTASKEFEVGGRGVGEFVQTGGTTTLNNWLNIGRYGGTGIVTVNGGSLVNTYNGEVYVGCEGGTGTINVGGTGEIEVHRLPLGGGWSGHQKGYLNISGDGKITTRQWVALANHSTGDNRSGYGEVNQLGGTFTIGTDISVGENLNGTGVYNMKAGKMTTAGLLRLGWHNGSKGTFTMDGGEVSVGSQFIVGAESGANGLLTINGGTLATPTITSGSGNATVLLNGGTIRSTADGNILNNIDNLVFDNGTTVDTDGHSTSIVGCGCDTVPGSSFVKAGTGTLTAAMPSVDTLIVSNGVFALSAAADNSKPLAALAHRWSFAGNLKDSVTSDESAEVLGSNSEGLTYSDGKAVLPGGGNQTCYINLGAGKIPSNAMTIELWFTPHNLVNWNHLFAFGDSSGNNGLPFCARRSNGVCSFDTTVQFASSSQLVNDTTYHIAISFAPLAGNRTAISVFAKAEGADAYFWTKTQTVDNWSLPSHVRREVFWLGRSPFGNNDIKADYDEVRIWNGALSEDAIALSYAKGADATDTDIAEILAKNAENVTIERTLDLAGGTLDLGGNTLTQPNLVGNGGTVRNGTLVVTDTIRLNVGDCITASGTIDLTNAKVEIVDVENLSTPFWFIKSAENATLTIIGKPEAENLPKGWQISTSSRGAKVQKVGFSIYVR